MSPYSASIQRYFCQAVALYGLLLATLTLQAGDANFDLSFNGTGNDYIVGGAPAETDSTSALCVQADGKLLLGGVHTVNLFSHAVRLYRRNANGGADPSFTPASVPVTISNIENVPYLRTCALQPDGKILFSALHLPKAPNELVVYRLNTDGTPDESFGPGGRRAVVFDLLPMPQLEITEVLAQSDGRIVLVGTHRVDNLVGAIVALRINTSGIADMSFGTRGQLLITRFAELQGGTSRDYASQAWITADGGVLIGGSTARTFETVGGPFPGQLYRAHIGLAKLTSAGQLDAAFGNGGVVDFDAGTGVNGLLDGYLSPSGKIAVLARVASSQQAFRDIGREFLRFLPNGPIDIGFGQLGRTALDPPNVTSGTLFVARTLAFQGEALLASGEVTAAGATDTLVVRLRADGTRDPDFSTGEYGNGLAVLRTGNNGAEGSYAVGVQAGKPIIAGDLRIGPNTNMHYLYRLSPTQLTPLRDGFE